MILEPTCQNLGNPTAGISCVLAMERERVFHSADAEWPDFVALFGDDDTSSEIPCLGIYFISGLLELVHVPMVEGLR